MEDTTAASRLRWILVAMAAACFVAMLAAVLFYRPVPAVVAGAVALACLFQVGKGRRMAVLALGVALAGLLWLSFGTVRGYFWLNRLRLEALTAELAEVPAIQSLNLGSDDLFTRAADGHRIAYDDYRFINGIQVTHYRRQVRPDAERPVVHVDDFLERAGVPRERYFALRERFMQLSLGGFGRNPDGQISLSEPAVGGRPWGYGFVFRPDGGEPQTTGIWDCDRLAARWFHCLFN